MSREDKLEARLASKIVENGEFPRFERVAEKGKVRAIFADGSTVYIDPNSELFNLLSQVYERIKSEYPQPEMKSGRLKYGRKLARILEEEQCSLKEALERLLDLIEGECGEALDREEALEYAEKLAWELLGNDPEEASTRDRAVVISVLRDIEEAINDGVTKEGLREAVELLFELRNMYPRPDVRRELGLD